MLWLSCHTINVTSATANCVYRKSLIEMYLVYSFVVIGIYFSHWYAFILYLLAYSCVAVSINPHMHQTFSQRDSNQMKNRNYFWAVILDILCWIVFCTGHDYSTLRHMQRIIAITPYRLVPLPAAITSSDETCIVDQTGVQCYHSLDFCCEQNHYQYFTSNFNSTIKL